MRDATRYTYQLSLLAETPPDRDWSWQLRETIDGEEGLLAVSGALLPTREAAEAAARRTMTALGLTLPLEPIEMGWVVDSPEKE